MKRFRECLNVDIGGAGIESFTVPISLVLEMAYNTKSIVWMYIESIHLLLCLSTVHMTGAGERVCWGWGRSGERGARARGCGEGPGGGSGRASGLERCREGGPAREASGSGAHARRGWGQQGTKGGVGVSARGLGRTCGEGRGGQEGVRVGAQGARVERVGAGRKTSGLGLGGACGEGQGGGSERPISPNTEPHPISGGGILRIGRGHF